MAKNEATATVTRSKAKQEDLPEIQPSDRKIAELENLGDELADCEDVLAQAKHRKDEANENLVVAMRRRERTFYSRQTWGSILLTEPGAVKAKVKKAHAGGGEEEVE